MMMVTYVMMSTMVRMVMMMHMVWMMMVMYVMMVYRVMVMMVSCMMSMMSPVMMCTMPVMYSHSSYPFTMSSESSNLIFLLEISGITSLRTIFPTLGFAFILYFSANASLAVIN